MSRRQVQQYIWQSMIYFKNNLVGVGAHPIRTVHTAVSDRFCVLTVQFACKGIHMDIWYHQDSISGFQYSQGCAKVWDVDSPTKPYHSCSPAPHRHTVGHPLSRCHRDVKARKHFQCVGESIATLTSRWHHYQLWPPSRAPLPKILVPSIAVNFFYFF